MQYLLGVTNGKPSFHRRFQIKECNVNSKMMRSNPQILSLPAAKTPDRVRRSTKTGSSVSKFTSPTRGICPLPHSFAVSSPHGLSATVSPEHPHANSPQHSSLALKSLLLLAHCQSQLWPSLSRLFQSSTPISPPMLSPKAAPVLRYYKAPLQSSIWSTAFSTRLFLAPLQETFTNPSSVKFEARTCECNSASAFIRQCISISSE